MNKKLSLALFGILILSAILIAFSNTAKISYGENETIKEIEIKTGEEGKCDNAGGCLVTIGNSKIPVANGAKIKVNNEGRATIEEGIATLFNKVDLTNVEGAYYDNDGKSFVAVAIENCKVKGKDVEKGTHIIVNSDGIIRFEKGTVTSEGQKIVIPEGSTAEFTGNQILAVGDIQVAGLNIEAGSNLEIVAGQVRVPEGGSATINNVQINANTAYVVICNTAACSGANYAAFTPTTITLKGDNAFRAFFEEGNPYINMVPGSYVDAMPLNSGIITISENKVSTQGAPGKLDLPCAEIANGAMVYTIDGRGGYKIDANTLMGSGLESTNLEIIDYKGNSIIVMHAYTNTADCYKCSDCFLVIKVKPDNSFEIDGKTYTALLKGEKIKDQDGEWYKVIGPNNKIYFLKATPGELGGYALYDGNEFIGYFAGVNNIISNGLGYGITVKEGVVLPEAEQKKNRDKLIKDFKSREALTGVRKDELAALEPGINRLIDIAKGRLGTPNQARLVFSLRNINNVNIKDSKEAERYLWRTYYMYPGRDY